MTAAPTFKMVHPGGSTIEFTAPVDGVSIFYFDGAEIARFTFCGDGWKDQAGEHIAIDQLGVYLAALAEDFRKAKP